MLLAAVRAQLRPHTRLTTRLCSSGPSTKNKNKNTTWSTLNRIPTLDSTAPPSTSTSIFPPELEALYRGNQRFRDAIAASATPDVLRDLAKQGQRPPFLLLDCSDSRVGEQVIFSAEPGTLFTTGNVANQFHEHDLNSKAVLAYAVATLRVKHVIVMGHYGCGGVAAATLPAPPSSSRTETKTETDPVQEWIAPIRRVYETSARPEIVKHREERRLRIQEAEAEAPPDLHDPAFRALVEENVKANVTRIACSAVITNHYASLPNPNPESEGVFVHGWVYDIETGEVADLGVTIGPPGRAVPVTPFPRRG